MGKHLITAKPGVLFAMRYPNDIGYVWNTIALSRDFAASHLIAEARCFIAHPELTPNPAYSPQNLQPVALDCYSKKAVDLESLERFIQVHNIRVIVFMSALPSTLDMGLFRRLGVRTINTENDSFDPAKRDSLLLHALKFCMRRVLKRQIHAYHLANAESQKDFLLRYALIPPNRVRVIYDGINCERYSPGGRQVACAQTGLDPERCWVISVSQARPEKRIDRMIRIARRVIDARPKANIGFVYVGASNSPIFSEWQALAAELKLGDRFLFAGAQNDLVPFYRAANLMAHTSELESFGLSIVEAMACGLPVVASAAAGPQETISHGQTGILVDLQDDDAFANAILHYLDNEALRERHGIMARERALALFNIERQAVEMAELISGLLHP
ncbi:glycosyltransferase involved in cell wall biosynthesis [Paucimonas lemoignei]|uniref:Glycosyltransferase involved in cell wall biosynthesis n=1 Tax=Paucimonas lemoignei TaxID=29443 RepID=A0A4R3HZ87_PAULE|nr:glycosyltransferase family 4 protein [Paucimonas lemoignei]TCS38558.1 glycosyltransferase involved in cell wall biosynthesis [Paucimonas lemoignei]